MSFATLAMIGLSLWPFGHDRQTESKHYVIPAWHIDVVRDRFTQERHCRVYQGNRHHPSVVYAHHAVGFQFNKKFNTANAWIQIDGSRPQPWTSVYPDLVGAGATLPGKSMDNPTEGLVLIPMSAFKGAHVIVIRAVGTKRPVTFGVDGLNDVLGTAHNLSCDLDRSFDR